MIILSSLFILRSNEEGTGKSTLGKIFKMLSPELTAYIDLKSVFDTFNTPIKGKTLIFCDEVEKNKESIYDKLKDLTGKDTITINEKNEKQKECERMLHIFITSNCPRPLYYSEGSRRIIQTYVKPCDKQYYKNLYKVIKNKNFSYNFSLFLKKWTEETTEEYLDNIVQTAEDIAREQNTIKLNDDDVRIYTNINILLRYVAVLQKYLIKGCSLRLCQHLLKIYEEQEQDNQQPLNGKIKTLINSISTIFKGTIKKNKKRNLYYNDKQLIKRLQIKVLTIDENADDLQKYKGYKYDFDELEENNEHIENMTSETSEPEIIKICDENNNFLFYDLYDSNDWEE